MKQLIIPTEKHAGELAKVMEVLAVLKVNINTLDAQEREEHGWIILTVDQYDHALQGLTQAGYNVISEEALVISVPDEPGALAQIARRFQDAKISIQSLHILRRIGGLIHVNLVADDVSLAKKLVADILFTQE